MQRLSITVRLNRSVLQFDEAAHARLERYLAESASLLEGDPDPQEILGDLEQAVADQCTRRMQPGQTVVTVAELEPALEEIGSVQAPGHGPASLPREAPPRSLQQVSEGAVISGVCLGLARYFQLDVTLLRVIAVLLLLGTGGGMILVYLGLMLLMPYAPLQPGGARVRWLPAKCRAFMEFLRAKLGVDRRGRIAA
jgi:phage shock protein PspC (stress-responsive transcriptional regulator)